VGPASRAAVAVGADGLLLEVHSHPDRAWCDGAQSLDVPSFVALMHDLRGREAVR
jgi:3-deoxy-7-phosphoheptulonate synthase